MTELVGFLFVATLMGILIRFVITTVLGAIAAMASEESPPIAVFAAIGSFIGAVAALGSFIVALIKLFES